MRVMRRICIARVLELKIEHANETGVTHLHIRSDTCNHLATRIAFGSDGSKGNIPPSTVRVDGLAIKLSESTSGVTMGTPILVEQFKVLAAVYTVTSRLM